MHVNKKTADDPPTPSRDHFIDVLSHVTASYQGCTLTRSAVNAKQAERGPYAVLSHTQVALSLSPTMTLLDVLIRNLPWLWHVYIHSILNITFINVKFCHLGLKKVVRCCSLHTTSLPIPLTTFQLSFFEIDL